MQILTLFSLITIVSLWSLYFYRNALIVIIISTIILLASKNLFCKHKDKASNKAISIALIISFLAAYPFLLLHPFVEASADPAAHISSLAIKETMPKNYLPFSELEYRYQIGFPLLAKTFIEIVPFIESQIIVWILGIIFVFLSSMLIYFLCKNIFNSEFAGLFGISLFIGSKIVFQNTYWGQYTFIMASTFFLATLLAVKKNSNLKYLFFPTIIITHPGVALYSVPFFIAHELLSKEFKETLKLLLTGFLAAPTFWITYRHFIENFGAEETKKITIETLKETLVAFPLWIGLLIFCLTIASIFFIFTKKMKQDNFTKILVWSFSISAILSIALVSSGRVLGGRIIELSMFSGLFLSVFFIMQITKSFEKKQNKEFENKLIIGIIAVSLILFFSSSQLSYLAKGSKITKEEIEFAFAFKKFDPEYKKTLFLLENNTKIAEVSNKIPFDVLTGWYLSYDKRISSNDPNIKIVKAKHELAEKIRLEKCVECIKEVEVEYIVTKEDFFSERLGLKKVFEYREYKVFSKN
ncbi:MAG: hypothetical protein QXU92_01230 [Candidatus Diapherotrites archaeon]